MKRISILSALLLMCAMTFAQQALWGGAPVVSPEIHDNNTVTFPLEGAESRKGASNWRLPAYAENQDSFW